MNNVKENKEMIDELRNFVIATAKEAKVTVGEKSFKLPESYIFAMTSAARIVIEYDKDNNEDK